jgi:uroporphyrinogen-III synthase
MRAGLRVLITRPAAQSAQIEALLRRHGADVLSLPLFEIQSAGDAASHARLLDTARGWDGWLFTSANAARETAKLDAGAWPTLYAIGEATARALAGLGHPGARHAMTGSSSEDLLAQADLQRVEGRRFLLCTGQGGRDLLAPGLIARGAQVQRLEVYRRAAVEHSEGAVRAAAAGSDAIVCTSGESLERLCQLLPNDLRSAVTSRLLVVPSPRVLELARRLGFAEVRAPQRTSDESLVECLFPPA